RDALKTKSQKAEYGKIRSYIGDSLNDDNLMENKTVAFANFLALKKTSTEIKTQRERTMEDINKTAFTNICILQAMVQMKPISKESGVHKHSNKTVFSEQLTLNVSRIESLEGELYEAFKSDRLLDGSVRFWAPIKKNKLKSVVKPAINYSLSSVLDHQPNSWIAIADGMGELQALNKTIGVKTYADIADVFTQKIERKYWQYDELHIVFDMYLDKSIKHLARNKRLHRDVATQYKICDNSDISNINMKKLLSHTLADKMSVTHCSLDCLKSNQKETNTKILLHAIIAKDRGSDRLLVFAQDTDILALLVRLYPRLPELTFFVTSSGEAISVQNVLFHSKPSELHHCPNFTHYQVATPLEVCLEWES
ncbi:hypothetical protein ILUMI_14491, partial [Ignelater luminosus]